MQWKAVALGPKICKNIFFEKMDIRPFYSDMTIWRKFGRRFIRKDQWPPNSPDCNPKDYFFWDAMTRKVYENQRTPFVNIEELNKRIKKVWKDAYIEKAVVSENEGPIKSYFD